MPTPSCASCVHFKPDEGRGPHVGECHRRAPIRDPERDRINEWRQTVWPLTLADDLCGDYDTPYVPNPQTQQMLDFWRRWLKTS